MNLTYNNVNLASLGTLRVLGRNTSREPAEAPQRERVVYRMRLDFFQQSFQNNFTQIQQFLAALATQNVNLLWQDDNGTIYENRTVTAGSDELPEEVMAKGGTYWQGITFHFWFYNHNIISNCLNANCFGQDMGAVATWREGLRSTRFDELHPQRKFVGGTVTASGRYQADTTQPLASRQQALMAIKDQMIATLTPTAQGNLTFGTFNQVVRVVSFEASVNQPNNYIDWTLSVTFTRYPDEADYALFELRAQTRLAKPENITYLSLTGKIDGPSQSACTNRLALITAALVPSGYAQILSDITPTTVTSESDAVLNGFPSGDGTVFTSLQFNLEYRDTSTASCTYQRTGVNTPVLAMGTVDKFGCRYATTLFDEMRNQRRRDAGTVTISGRWFVSDSLTPAAQQAALTTQLALFQTEFQKGTAGSLIYGASVTPPQAAAFSQVVRVMDFQANIDRFSNCIVWSFTGNYTVFPNESDYALCEFQLATENDLLNGTIFKSIRGEIWAPTYTAAQSKLARLRTAVIPAGFTMIRDNTTGNTVDTESNLQTTGTNQGEGPTFIRLTIDERWQATTTGNVLQFNLKISTDSDIKTAFVTTTYSGSVLATAVDQPTAFAAALAQAQALGANQGSFPIRSTVVENEKLFQTAGANVFVTVDFSYEYLSKGTNIYLEVTSEVMNDNFGQTLQTITGTIAAPTLSAAQASYVNSVRNVLATSGTLILTERTPTASFQELQDGSGNELASLDDRYSFSLQLLLTKSSGSTAITYTLGTATDVQQLEIRTIIEGTVFGPSQLVAQAFLTTFLGTQTLPGNLIENLVTPEFKQGPATGGGVPATVFVSMKFRYVYVSLYTGFVGIIQSEVVQDIQYSGNRNLEMGLPVGNSIIQQLGIVAGRQTVTARAISTTAAAAEAWVRTIRAALLNAANGSGVQAYEEPAQVKTDYTFLPLVTGIVTGGTANVKLYEVTGTFREILPDYGFVP